MPLTKEEILERSPKSMRDIPLNLKGFFIEAEELGNDIGDLDTRAIFDDAYAIFAANLTQEGAEAAATFICEVYDDHLREMSAALKALAQEYQINRIQKRRLQLEARFAKLDRSIEAAIENLRDVYIESAVNGTMEKVAEAQDAFGDLLSDALYG
ncbi:MAG TPA: hypothetical protein VGN75_03895 [Kaistia sp.]|jgi:hypothetical protein|nr:hypothetical protein [Kaistia sp.]